MATKGTVHILVCAILESMDMVANVFIFSTSTSRKVIFLSSSYPCWLLCCKLRTSQFRGIADTRNGTTDQAWTRDLCSIAELQPHELRNHSRFFISHHPYVPTIQFKLGHWSVFSCHPAAIKLVSSSQTHTALCMLMSCMYSFWCQTSFTVTHLSLEMFSPYLLSVHTSLGSSTDWNVLDIVC